MYKKVKVKGKKIEAFFADDGHVEIYELEDPGKTGFIFNDIKQFNMFINYMTDLAEEYFLEVNNDKV
jgi:hypothetical protein